jgi:anti-anti-sigma factor
MAQTRRGPAARPAPRRGQYLPAADRGLKAAPCPAWTVMTCPHTLYRQLNFSWPRPDPVSPIETMEPVLTIKAVRDGRVSALTLRGELDLCSVSELLTQAALTVDNQTERLLLDLAALMFLDCAGARALAMVAGFAPAACPVIIRSLSPRVNRVLELLGLDLETPGPSPEQKTPRRTAGRDGQAHPSDASGMSTDLVTTASA